MLDPMACLKDGIPLSLVIDLLEVDGPDTSWIYAQEPADTSWTIDPCQRAKVASPELSPCRKAPGELSAGRARI